MPRMTSYEPGTPSWVDLGTTDAAAARSFYGGLFGWDMEVGGAEAMGYTMCRRDGLSVAGIWELMPDMVAQGIPPSWTTYFSTSDVDGSIKRITDAGGAVMSGAMDIAAQGRMAVAADPAGAVFGLWEPAAHIGAELVNEPGAVVWNELLSRDEPAALAFYPEVFGFTVEDVDMGAPTPYRVLKVNDRMVAGLMAMPSDAPDEMPSQWATYFAVDDTDASVEQAKAAGATLLMGPEDSPYGRFAALLDPQGAAFCLLAVSADADGG